MLVKLLKLCWTCDHPSGESHDQSLQHSATEPVDEKADVETTQDAIQQPWSGLVPSGDSDVAWNLVAGRALHLASEQAVRLLYVPCVTSAASTWPWQSLLQQPAPANQPDSPAPAAAASQTHLQRI